MLTCISENTRKWNISEPYNFQHLTHANPKHLPEIHRATQHELVTEFSAIRASQAPRRQLRGIKAENLHFRNFSSETLLRDVPSPAPVDPTTPPSLSPTRSSEFMRRGSPSPQGGGKAARYTRSVENFSLPSPRSPRFSIIPPPRTSSRAAVSMCSDGSMVHREPPTAPTLPGSPVRSVALSPDNADSIASFSPWGTAISMDDSIHNLISPHAVTTPDDSALHLLPLPFGTPGTELADVPEEDEDYFRRRNSVRSSRPSTAGSALRHAQSFPTTKSPAADRPTSHHPSRGTSDAQGQHQRPTSSSSNVLASTFRLELPANNARPAMPSKRVSRNLKGIEGCWEDAIDYCYQHAAEADCDYDWDRRSRDGGEDEVDDIDVNSTNADATHVDATHVAEKQVVANQTAVTLVDANQADEYTCWGKEWFSRRNGFHKDAVQTGQTRNTHLAGKHQPYSFLSTDVTIPELEPSSALSESTSGAGPPTPSMAPLPPPSVEISVPNSKGSAGFCLSPSVLTSPDYEAQMLEESLYQELLGDSANSDRHYAFYNGLEEVPESRTDSLLSKCNSQESMSVSRAASAQRNHRSTTSSGSLPELVHSKYSRERFDIVADELAEQIASLSTTETAVDTQRSISPVHKRRISLAKEVAHQSMLKKATGNPNAEDVEFPAPLVQPTRRRDRSCSDEPVKANPTPSNYPAKRLRSSSSATSASSRRSSRVSYTLFPTSTNRSIS